MYERCYYAYIVASKTHAIYVGMTSMMVKRMWQHKTHALPGFTAKYNCDQLVWWERFNDPVDAILREKQIKGWLRKKKIALIETMNPEWKDLAGDWFNSDEVLNARRDNGDQRV